MLFKPPELLHFDEAEIGPGSDVFSLGATLYSLAYGRKPFSTIDAMLSGSVDFGCLPSNK